MNMRIGCEMGLFPALGKNNQPQTLAQLSESTKSDPKLLRKSLYLHMASFRFG